MRTFLLLVTGTALLAVGALGTYGCGDDGTAAPATDYTPTLNTVAESVVLPANADFVTQADALASAARAFETSPTTDTLAAAQAAWRTARRSWRKLDALHFGPVADLGISDRIDVSPAVPAQIEKVVVATTTVDATLVGAQGGPAKGFLGVEYLLFGKTLLELTGDGAPARRRTLARYQAEEIAAAAHQVADGWTGAGNYRNVFVTAGRGSARYVSQRAAVDDVVGGVAYALEIVVGVRLATPLGRKKVGGGPDPSLDYTSASDSTAADIGATLDGVDAVYVGQGLSTRVKTSSPALDSAWTNEIRDCASKVAGLSTPFDTAVTSATATVQASYDACKTAKGTWNTGITTALGATLRPSDNDGD